MANQVENEISSDLLPLLQEERYVTIATIDHETGAPSVNAISWVYAPHQTIVYFALDLRSKIVENIKANSKITLTTIANETTYSISGNASVKIEKLEDVPLKLALIEIKVDSVRDVMFYGAKISTEPSYEKTYDKDAAAKLDKQVMDAMKNVKA